MKKVFAVLLIWGLSISCSKGAKKELVNPLDDTALLYNKKIENLHKKLGDKEKSLQSSTQDIKNLRYKLHSEELSAIRQRVESFEEFLRELKMDSQKFQGFLKKDLPTLFLKEREALTAIIQSTQGLDKDAQVLLDRILRIITSLNNSAIANSCIIE